MAVDEPLEIRLGRSYYTFVAYLANGIIEYRLRGLWAQPVASRDMLAGGGVAATRLPAKPYLGWQNDVIDWVRAAYPSTFTVQ